MLDVTVDTASDDVSQSQPRRRRVAGRPSGPPTPVAPPTLTDQPMLEAEDAPPVDATRPDSMGSDSDAEPVPPAAENGACEPGPQPMTGRSRSRTADEPADDEVPGSVSTSDASLSRSRTAMPVAGAGIEQTMSASQAGSARETITPDVGQALAALEPRPRRRAARPAGAPAPIDLEAIRKSLQDPEPAAGQDQPDDPMSDEPQQPVTEADTEPQDPSEGDAVIAAAPPQSTGLPEITDPDQAALEDQAEPQPNTEEEPPAESEESAEAEGDDEDAPRRRRRRRGGRRRRRAGDAADDNEEHDSDETTETGDGEQEKPDSDEAEESGSGTRRRRRRRRRGEEATTSEDDPSDVVVRVREPRQRRGSGPDEVSGIEGSTRMEAKRQRRREGRAAGRRRAPILSEAEFLARRESVTRQMLVRQKDDYSQIAVIEDGILVEHYVDRASATSLIGNVYLGRVQNVLPSMEAAFIDIGRGRNAVLYAGEVDWDSFGADGQSRKVEKVFKSGQTVLVQVTKDPVGAKGARLTAHISLPGRYLVYAPGGHLSGISRKLPEQERNRLKELLGELVGDRASVIIRTAAEGASEEELVRDVNRLTAQWEAIEKKVKQGSAPQLLYGEPDLTVRIVRDLFTEDFAALVIDGNGLAEDAFDMVKAYVDHVAPHLSDRVSRWNRDEGDIFTRYRVDEQIAKALERKVFLPSGGSLIIDRTEAMTVIDVNTGRFTGSGGNLEATVTSNNLEAAEEIVRQLRLRDIGGIIVIDFIDMVLPSNRELLLRRLVECLGRDRTRHQVAEVTSLGLVQMTRKKIGTGLAEAFTETCAGCGGRGYHRHTEPVDTQAPADGGDRSGRRGRRS